MDHREQILDLIGAGFSRAEIAAELDLSSNVVKRILRRECRRYDVDMEGLRRLTAGRPGARGVVSPP